MVRCRKFPVQGGGLLALLVVELALVSVWFDRWQMASEHGWLIFGYLNSVLRIGVAIATATAIVAAARQRPQLSWASAPVGRMRRAWPFLVGHMVALAGFVVLSELVFKENAGVLPDAEITVSLWVVVGLTSMALWVAAFLSTSDGGRLWRRGLHALPLGVVVGLAAWGAGDLTLESWQLLHLSTFWLVHTIMGRIVGHGFISQPQEFIIGTPRFTVQIGEMCCGYEGIGLILILLGIYLWIFRKRLRFPRAFAILPLGMVVIWVANALRIVALILVGDRISPAVALGGFHSVAGWLAFDGVGLSLVALTHRSRFLTLERSAGEPRLATSPTAAYLTPLLAIIATAMITGAFATDVECYYPLRVLAAAAMLGYHRRSYAECRGEVSWWWGGAIGVVVFALWIALEIATGRLGFGLCATGTPCEPAAQLGCARDCRPRCWISHHGTTCRGAGIPWLPGAALDRQRFHVRPDRSVHLDFVPDLIGALRSVTRAVVGRDVGRHALCRCAVSSR